MKYSLIIGLLVFTLQLSAQDHKHDHTDHDHTDHDHPDHVHHSHHRNEIGLAVSPYYFFKEKEWTYGVHFHYLYYIKDNKWGFGLGYERIFDDHEHQTYGLVASYRLIEKLSLNLAPGFTFENEEDSSAAFALHLETTYEFEMGNFHIGPVMELAYDPEDIHFSLGIHLAFGF